MAPAVAPIITALLVSLTGPTVAIQSMVDTSSKLSGFDLGEFIIGLLPETGDMVDGIKSCNNLALDLPKVTNAVLKLGSSDTFLTGVKDFANELAVLPREVIGCSEGVNAAISYTTARFTAPASFWGGFQAVVKPVLHFTDIVGHSQKALDAFQNESYREAGTHIKAIFDLAGVFGDDGSTTPLDTPPAASPTVGNPTESSPTNRSKGGWFDGWFPPAASPTVGNPTESSPTNGSKGGWFDGWFPPAASPTVGNPTENPPTNRSKEGWFDGWFAR